MMLFGFNSSCLVHLVRVLNAPIHVLAWATRLQITVIRSFCMYFTDLYKSFLEGVFAGTTQISTPIYVACYCIDAVNFYVYSV